MPKWVESNRIDKQRRRGPAVAFCAGLVCVLIAAEAQAQLGPARRPDPSLVPELPQREPVESGRPLKPVVLGPQYVDGTYAIAFKPPANLNRDRQIKTRFGEKQIVSFARVEDGWSLSVRIGTPPDRWNVDAVVTNAIDDLRMRYEEVRLLREVPQRVTDRSGVRLEVTFVTEGTDWLTQQVMVPYLRGDFLHLVFTTPLADREETVRVFDRVIATLEITRTESEQERIEAALQRGAALLGISAESNEALSARAAAPRYMRVIKQGHEIGYLETLEGTTTFREEKGLEAKQEGWLFDTDGSIEYLRENMFVADNLRIAAWESRQETLLVPEKLKRNMIIQKETGYREGTRLIVKYPPDPKAPDRSNSVIKRVTRSFISPIWQVLMPRVLDLDKPELYAFFHYDRDRRDFSLRTVEVMGSAKVLVGTTHVDTTRLRESEGLIPPYNEIFVDDHQRIVHVRSGEIEMIETDRSYVERTYERQIETARDAFQQMLRAKKAARQRGSR